MPRGECNMGTWIDCRKKKSPGEGHALGQLQNAASAAGLLLTTEVMIAEAPKDDDHAHGGAPGGMCGMDM